MNETVGDPGHGHNSQLMELDWALGWTDRVASSRSAKALVTISQFRSKAATEVAVSGIVGLLF